ncbi:MAG TPA: hypothetical protein DCS63_04905 [Elusimicrobia bacterium]|nr:hypothetical protein [Elusimicrobiota bacterium]
MQRSSRGFAYLQLGRYSEAISDFDKVLESNPNSPRAFSLRAGAYNHIINISSAAAQVARTGLGTEYSKAPLYDGQLYELLKTGDKKKTLAFLDQLAGTTRRDAAPPVADIKPRPYAPSKLLSEIMELRKNADGASKMRYWTTLGDMEKKLAKEIAKEIMENRIICETLFPASIRYQYGVYPLIRALNLKDNALVQYLLDNEKYFNIYYEEGGFTVEALTETRLQPLWGLPEGRAAILEEAAGNLALWVKSFCLTEDESCEYGTSQKYINEEILRILERFKSTELNKESLKILDLYESKLFSYTISNWGMPIKPGQKAPPEVITGISNSLAKVKALRKQYSSKAS